MDAGRSVSELRQERRIMKTCDIRIRDPYVLTDTDAGRYYLYGTTAVSYTHLDVYKRQALSLLQ